MKLLRFGEAGCEKPGLLDATGAVRDVSAAVDDWRGDALLPDNLSTIAAMDASGFPAVSGAQRIGPCVARPGKFICIGLNYAKHAAESGVAAPREPVIFGKATSALCGPNDDLVIPRGASKVDWEVELGVVIGRPAKYVREEDAPSHIVGYCVVHDVSEREFQLERHGQWIKGKSCDTFGPIGPYLVTPDEIQSADDLRLWLSVDDEICQDSSTADMIFKVPHLVSYLSQFMSLQTGDIISTGTPEGVGLGRKPPSYLRPGQVVTLGVEGLGEQRQRVVSETPGN